MLMLIIAKAFVKHLMTTFSISAGFPVNTKLQIFANIKTNLVLIWCLHLTLKDDIQSFLAKICGQIVI